MYSSNDLKEKIKTTSNSVECPVNNCKYVVPRQRKVFRKEDKFKCPTHNIYISPSTFEYSSELDNLIWVDKEDQLLLKKIKKVKRESRITRENSEDAISWNVFRYLERNNLLNDLLFLISNDYHTTINIIYWSYYQHDINEDGWTWLNKARVEFGEVLKKGSEPDIIILTDKTLFFVEAKVQSGNNTLPFNSKNRKLYPSGGNNWFYEVFNSNYEEVVFYAKKYELMRFWLLGTWVAHNLGLKFHLINLVLEGREIKIEDQFRKHIKENSNNKFSRFTWEEIYYLVEKLGFEGSDSKIFLEFFRTKTAGYGDNKKLRKRFKTN